MFTERQTYTTNFFYLHAEICLLKKTTLLPLSYFKKIKVSNLAFCNAVRTSLKLSPNVKVKLVLFYKTNTTSINYMSIN